jgi:uncharacterized membrane protein
VRGIFGEKREEVRGEWRRLHNEEVHNLYRSRIIIIIIIIIIVIIIIIIIYMVKRRIQGHVARIGQKTNACRILMEQPNGK